MKQTNNAIKFLMAQYRAIFRNANLKMFLAAATAAAALAAGSAQAAPSAFDKNAIDTAKQDLTIDGQGQTDNSTFTKIELVEGDKDKNKGFNITVSSGGGSNIIKGGVDFSSSSITVSGSTADAKLTIQKGDATVANVKLKSLAVQEQGELVVTGAADSGTTVTASTISFGNGKDSAKSVVKIDGHSTVIAGALTKDVEPNAEVGKLTINKATVTVSGGGTLTGNNILITDGAITLGGGDGAGALGSAGSDTVPATSSINMESGTITVAKSTSGSLVGNAITLNNGKIDNSGNLTIGKAAGSFVMNGGTIENKESDLTVASKAGVSGGTLTVTSGSVTFAEGADFGSGSTISLAKDGTLVLSKDSKILTDKVTTAAGAKLRISEATATMSAATLTKFLTGEIHGKADSSSVGIHFTDDKVDLGKDNLVLSGAGVLNDKYKSGDFLFSGKEALYSAGNLINTNTTLKFDTLKLGKDGTLTVSGGADLFVGYQLAVNGTAEAAKGLVIESGSVVLQGTKGSVDAKLIDVNQKASPASLKVSGGEWTVPTLKVTSGEALVSQSDLTVSGDLTVTVGKVSLDSGSTLKVTGDITTTASTGSIEADASHIDTVGGGKVTLGANGVSLKNTADLQLEVKDFQKDNAFSPEGLKGAILGQTNTTLTIWEDAANKKKLSLTDTQFDALQKAVGTGFKGSFDVNVIGAIADAKDGMDLGKVKDGLAADAYKNISAKQDAATAVSGNKTIGSVELTGTGSELKLDANGAALGLYSAKDGKFVYTKDEKGNTTAADVSFAGAENSLTLVGTGEIGAIKNTSGAAAGALTIGTADKSGTVTVKGAIGATGANKGVESVTVNANSYLNVEGGVYTTNLDMRQGTSLNAKDGAGDVVVTGKATILGSIDAGTLDLSGTGSIKHSIAGDSVIDVTNLKLAANNMLIVGTDGDKDGNGSTTASVFADTLTMGTGSSLFVDPHPSKAAAFVVVDKISNGSTGQLDGAVYIGQNAGLGYGFADKQDFMEVVGGYLNAHGAFGDGEKDVKNALVLNKPLSISASNGIVVNAGLKESDIKSPLDNNHKDALTLAAGSALILTDDAFKDNAGTAKPAVTFAQNAYVHNAEGSKVVLVGDFNKNSSLELFKSTAGNVTLDKTMTLSAAGGLLEATIASGAYATPTQLTTVKGYQSIARAGVSAPVGQVFIDYVDGNLKYVKDTAGHDFLIGCMQSAEGRKQFDAAAHAATYAGAQQAAVAAVGTMAGAVGGRVGSMGVEAATITATGSQANGGVWLAPMYQSVDADGFNAEGGSYGADVDLGGVAFGADTVNGNMRFGAVFNIGSGDADGKGNGAGLKDEFDYYGFGIYSVMGFGQLAIVGDASLSVISHEVEGLKAKGEADTTAVTMGVTGQYTISNPMVDVTPHLGARFIRLDTDSYDLTVGGKTLATTDFDVQNVFSIPLGVTLSKAFEMGGWSLAPSADLSITFNTGDTDAKSTTRFDGIQRDIGLSTEVLDEVTYGVAVGLGAQYGSFGTQIGINYTGSENTDSFGVNANARYMF